PKDRWFGRFRRQSTRRATSPRPRFARSSAPRREASSRPGFRRRPDSRDRRPGPAQPKLETCDTSCEGYSSFGAGKVCETHQEMRGGRKSDQNKNRRRAAKNRLRSIDPTLGKSTGIRKTRAIFIKP